MVGVALLSALAERTAAWTRTNKTAARKNVHNDTLSCRDIRHHAREKCFLKGCDSVWPAKDNTVHFLFAPIFPRPLF
jgi:hypothetical protein